MSGPPNRSVPPGRERPAAARSLCQDCIHVQIITSARGSTFLLCKVSRDDPRFPKYPPQPVLACPKYAR